MEPRERGAAPSPPWVGRDREGRSDPKGGEGQTRARPPASFTDRPTTTPTPSSADRSPRQRERCPAVRDRSTAARRRSRRSPKQMSLLLRIDWSSSPTERFKGSSKDPRSPSAAEGKFTLRRSLPRIWVPYVAFAGPKGPWGFREKAALALVPLRYWEPNNAAINLSASLLAASRLCVSQPAGPRPFLPVVHPGGITRSAGKRSYFDFIEVS
jgi:hypothetical protein